MSETKHLSSDELAIERTVMATDRTLMAWTRTALSLISFGFTIYKFLQAARQEKVTPNVTLDGPRHLGIAMISLGVVFLLLAAVQYWVEMRKLNPLHRLSAVRLPFVLAVLLSLVGLLALSNVAFKVGPF